MGNSSSSSSSSQSQSQPQPSDEQVFANRNRQKTFNVKKGSLRFQKGMTLKANLAATLQGQVDMREAVKLPHDQELNEWLAINTFIFYEIAVNVHKSVEHICTKESCPKMTAGKNVVYLWADGKKVKKPVELSAPEYIENLFEWVFEQMSDPALFPQDDDSKFPKSFIKTVKNIYKRLFRLYAHVFHTHFNEVEAIGAEAHLNSSFKHLMYFILEFDLVEESELSPLKNLIDILRQAH